jgi:hypothetical protein
VQAQELHVDEKQKKDDGKISLEEVLRGMSDAYPAPRGQSLNKNGVSSSNWLERRTPNPVVAGSTPA